MTNNQSNMAEPMTAQSTTPVETIRPTIVRGPTLEAPRGGPDRASFHVTVGASKKEYQVLVALTWRGAEVPPVNVIQTDPAIALMEGTKTFLGKEIDWSEILQLAQAFFATREKAIEIERVAAREALWVERTSWMKGITGEGFPGLIFRIEQNPKKWALLRDSQDLVPLVASYVVEGHEVRMNTWYSNHSAYNNHGSSGMKYWFNRETGSSARFSSKKGFINGVAKELKSRLAKIVNDEKAAKAQATLKTRIREVFKNYRMGIYSITSSSAGVRIYCHPRLDYSGYIEIQFYSYGDSECFTVGNVHDAKFPISRLDEVVELFKNQIVLAKEAK